MIGGLLEYASLVVGYRSLLIVAVLLYGLAFVLGRSTAAQETVKQPVTLPTG